MAQPPQPDPGSVPFYYGRTARRALRAAVLAIRPRDGVFDRPVDDSVVGAILSFVPYMPAAFRLGLPAALVALELAPLLFGFGLRRFSSLPETEATAYLERWEHAVMPLPLFFESLRELVMVCFYQQPEILAALEVDWPARAEEQITRRARLQTMSPDLANPRNVEAAAEQEEVGS